MDEHLDKLMIRHLDGEITADEQLELDRALLRSPEARDRYEEYRRLDALAAAAIHDAVARRTNAETVTLGSQAATPLPSRHHWFAYGAALAACIALVLVWQTRQPPQQHGTPMTAQRKITSTR